MRLHEIFVMHNHLTHWTKVNYKTNITSCSWTKIHVGGLNHHSFLCKPFVDVVVVVPSLSCATIETKNKFCLRTFRHSCTYFTKLYNYHAYFATSSSTRNISKQFMFFVPICLITINLSKYHSKLLRISLSIYHIKLIGHIISMIRVT